MYYLEDYAKQWASLSVFIHHPLHKESTVDKTCFWEYVSDHLLWSSERRRSTFLPVVVSYLDDILLTLLYAIRRRRHFDIFVGADCLNALCGLILRAFGLVDQVVFYTIDLAPKRFANRTLNLMYAALDAICLRLSNCVWSVSEPMVLARRCQGLQDAKNILVPTGIKSQQPRTKDEIDSNAVVMIGALAPAKGVELLAKAFPEVIKKVPHAHLVIVGSGRMLDLIKSIPRVEYLGILTGPKLSDLLPRMRIGLALYQPAPSSDLDLTRFAEPGKVRDYLASGLPVILTRATHMAGVIEKRQAGLVIDYRVEDLVNAIVRLLMDDELYWRMRQNTLALSREFEPTATYGRALGLLVAGTKYCALK